MVDDEMLAYDLLPDDVKHDLDWWISEYVRPATGVNYNHTSYGLKHLFGSATGTYVSNDAFKGAMVEAGHLPVDASQTNWAFKIQRVRALKKHQPEAALERQLSRAVRQRGGKALKFNPTGWAGAPDRLVLLPGGRSVFVEMKAYGEQPRPLQLRRHEELAELGFEVRVIDSPEEIQAFLDEFFAE